VDGCHPPDSPGFRSCLTALHGIRCYWPSPASAAQRVLLVSTPTTAQPEKRSYFVCFQPSSGRPIFAKHSCLTEITRISVGYCCTRMYHKRRTVPHERLLFENCFLFNSGSRRVGAMEFLFAHSTRQRRCLRCYESVSRPFLSATLSHAGKPHSVSLSSTANLIAAFQSC
jgi:hypothetical protein